MSVNVNKFDAKLHIIGLMCKYLQSQITFYKILTKTEQKFRAYFINQPHKQCMNFGVKLKSNRVYIHKNRYTRLTSSMSLIILFTTLFWFLPLSHRAVGLHTHGLHRNPF